LSLSFGSKIPASCQGSVAHRNPPQAPSRVGKALPAAPRRDKNSLEFVADEAVDVNPQNPFPLTFANSLKGGKDAKMCFESQDKCQYGMGGWQSRQYIFSIDIPIRCLKIPMPLRLIDQDAAGGGKCV
jgi:hypothetical protein